MQGYGRQETPSLIVRSTVRCDCNGSSSGACGAVCSRGGAAACAAACAAARGGWEWGGTYVGRRGDSGKWRRSEREGEGSATLLASVAWSRVLGHTPPLAWRGVVHLIGRLGLPRSSRTVSNCAACAFLCALKRSGVAKQALVAGRGGVNGALSHHKKTRPASRVSQFHQCWRKHSFLHACAGPKTGSCSSTRCPTKQRQNGKGKGS